jgi:hypothetical protein
MSTRPQPRYLLLAAGLGLLAGLRAAEGATGWAALFAVAAVVNVGLAVAPAARPRRDGAGGARPRRVGAGAARGEATTATPPDAAQVRASGDLHARRARTWTVLTFACLATGALLVPLVPAFAVAAGALALVSLRAARRSRRSAGVLHAAA